MRKNWTEYKGPGTSKTCAWCLLWRIYWQKNLYLLRIKVKFAISMFL